MNVSVILDYSPILKTDKTLIIFFNWNSKRGCKPPFACSYFYSSRLASIACHFSFVQVTYSSQCTVRTKKSKSRCSVQIPNHLLLFYFYYFTLSGYKNKFFFQESFGIRSNHYNKPSRFHPSAFRIIPEHQILLCKSKACFLLFSKHQL